MIEGELEDTRSLKAKKEYTIKECVVVGAGISGIATARWLKVKKKPTCRKSPKIPISGFS